MSTYSPLSEVAYYRPLKLTNGNKRLFDKTTITKYICKKYTVYNIYIEYRNLQNVILYCPNLSIPCYSQYIKVRKHWPKHLSWIYCALCVVLV